MARVVRANDVRATKGIFEKFFPRPFRRFRRKVVDALQDLDDISESRNGPHAFGIYLDGGGFLPKFRIERIGVREDLGVHQVCKGHSITSPGDMSMKGFSSAVFDPVGNVPTQCETAQTPALARRETALGKKAASVGETRPL